MGIALPFRRRRGLAPNLWVLLLIAVVCMAGYFGVSHNRNIASQFERQNQRFAARGYFARDNCVIDGDTFYLAGEKIRIADIDAPETGGAQCSFEAALGARATARLRELLNEGPFELRGYRSRDRDLYGRKLRVVVRDGKSIGETLVSEGLARRWNGRREPWCV